MSHKSIMTQATQIAAQQMAQARKLFREKMGTPYMAETLSAPEFRRRYGISVTEARELTDIVGEETLKGIMGKMDTEEARNG